MATGKPFKRDPVIRKQMALLSLQWAHDKLASTKPIIENGTLKAWSHRVLANRPKKPATVEMEFSFNPKRLLDEHRMPARGDFVSFKLVGTDVEEVRKVRYFLVRLNKKL